MRLFYIAAFAISLGGCATVPYDNEAYQSAFATRHIGYDQCNARFANDNFKSNYALFDCIKDVEKAFAVAIKLKKMAIYEQYAFQLGRIANAADAGSIAMEERNKQYAAVRDTYFQTLFAAKAAADRQNQAAYSALGNGLAAFGTGYAQGQAASAANRPIICTSTINGGIVNTLC